MPSMLRTLRGTHKTSQTVLPVKNLPERMSVLLRSLIQGSTFYQIRARDTRTGFLLFIVMKVLLLANYQIYLKKKDALSYHPVFTISGSFLPGMCKGACIDLYTRCSEVLVSAPGHTVTCPVLPTPPPPSPPLPLRPSPGPAFSAHSLGSTGPGLGPLPVTVDVSGLGLCLAKQSSPPGLQDTNFLLSPTQGWTDMKDLTESLGRPPWKRDREPTAQGQIS